jgi:peptidyl-prolyl cis-trans isomerase A (cyclophilin A)
MNRRWLLLIPVLILVGCSSSTDTQKKNAEAERAASPPPAPPVEKAPEPAPAKAPPEKAPEPAPAPPPKKVETANTFKVKFETSKGPIIVEVHKDWAPIGAAHFEELVKAGFYNGARFFRVVPNFMVQFGIAANPAVTKKWDRPIQDDPVTQTNRVGAMTYAATGSPNSRSTQLFINLKSNQFLDSQGFAPFAMVVEGMEVVEHINSEYAERPDQGAMTAQGNAYLEAQFPRLDYIKTATIMK